jgi:Holliday junction resolvasome RuvABC endonuclease subunit
MIFMGVDPSIRNTGVAILSQSGNQFETTVLSPPKSSDEERIAYLYIQFKTLQLDEFTLVGIEKPAVEHSKRGFKARETGRIDKLYLAYSAIICGLVEAKAYKIIPLTVNQWKGQVPKTVTQQRMEKKYGAEALEGLSHDEIDALAIANKIFNDVKRQQISER